MGATSQSADTPPIISNLAFLTHNCKAKAPNSTTGLYWHTTFSANSVSCPKTMLFVTVIHGDETRCSMSPWVMTLEGALWTVKTNTVQYISISVEANRLSYQHRKDLVQLNCHQMTGWSRKQYQTWVSVMASTISMLNTSQCQYWIYLANRNPYS